MTAQLDESVDEPLPNTSSHFVDQLKDAWHKGADAAELGRDMELNPYKNPRLAKAWDEGYAFMIDSEDLTKLDTES